MRRRTSIALTLFALVLFSWAAEGRAQGPKQFFLNQPPGEAELSTLPANLTGLLIPKVRFVDRLAYLVGRDQSGKPPKLPRDLFWGRVEVSDVLSGKAEIGERQDVNFGDPLSSERYVYPYGPDLMKGEYFVVSYLGDDGVRRLWGFPISEEQFVAWEQQKMKYELARSKPGAHDM